MVGRFSRTLLATLMVAAVAGAAVAFAVGVQFAPRASCPNPGYGSTCPGPTHYKVGKNLKVNGLKGVRLRHFKLTIRNTNPVPVRIKLVLTIKSRSGRHIKTTRITRTFVLKPGGTYKLSKKLKLHHIRGAKLTLTISDKNGDHATVTRRL